MGIQQIQVTVTGNLGADPKSFGRNIDAPACSFRVGVTPRYFDGNLRQWRDRETTWIGVRAYRTLATNVLNSLHKGDPVIVTGMLRTERWRKEGEPVDRITPVVDAVAVGHDLSQGVGRFRRAGREQPAANGQGDGANIGGTGASGNGYGGSMPGGTGADPYGTPPSNDPVPGAGAAAPPVDLATGEIRDDEAPVYGAVTEDGGESESASVDVPDPGNTVVSGNADGPEGGQGDESSTVAEADSGADREFGDPSM
ncbi:single-stranded DNA-binding protein [Bifidobacterium sp. MA2]|uniref:Single-stranded DNA-binding protein n=1 Tax=Bifidobacterium santillanense TaxID=2809028 RepID=A0ABS5UNI9_9BIFI|nr:single-stranded DNA-binding protein [Bifidobacterium santillanense]MBT1172448.1 single-stranded DNA-binding protein [Bifidobacterium santillanense]